MYFTDLAALWEVDSVPEAAPGSVALRRCRGWGAAIVWWLWPLVCWPSREWQPRHTVFLAQCQDWHCWDSLLWTRQPLCAGPPRLTGLSRTRLGAGPCLLHTWVGPRRPVLPPVEVQPPSCRSFFRGARHRNVSCQAGFTLGFSWCHGADTMLVGGSLVQGSGGSLHPLRSASVFLYVLLCMFSSESSAPAHDIETVGSDWPPRWFPDLPERAVQAARRWLLQAACRGGCSLLQGGRAALTGGVSQTGCPPGGPGAAQLGSQSGL